MEHEMNKQKSKKPRIHYWWLLRCHDRGWFQSDTLQLLEEGYKISFMTMGSVQAIVKEGDYFYGAADPRRLILCRSTLTMKNF